MGNHRMFTNTITDSDLFLEMSLSAQALYFHLGLHADDEGFVSSPKRIVRATGCNEDDLKLLIAKGFVICFDPLNLWFDYPIHKFDDTGVLKDCNFEEVNSKNSPYKKNFDKKKSPEEIKKERKEALMTAFSAVQENGQASISDLASYLGKSEKTVIRHINENKDFWKDGNNVGLKQTDKLE